ncbi:putative transcription factor, K-box [Helianthus anomalus]
MFLSQAELKRSAILSKELAEKSFELRQMKGEDLQGLNLKDLNKLEGIIESGLAAVLKTKGERMWKEISTLKKKEAQLLEENTRLKQQLLSYYMLKLVNQIMDTGVGETNTQDHRSHHHSLTLTISNLISSRDPSHNYNFSNSDTCLKLG